MENGKFVFDSVEQNRVIDVKFPRREKKRFFKIPEKCEVYNNGNSKTQAAFPFGFEKYIDRQHPNKQMNRC